MFPRASLSIPRSLSTFYFTSIHCGKCVLWQAMSHTNKMIAEWKSERPGSEWDSLLLLLFRCCYSIYVNVFCENPSTHTHTLTISVFGFCHRASRPSSQPASQPAHIHLNTLAHWHWHSVWLCSRYITPSSFIVRFVHILYMGTTNSFGYERRMCCCCCCCRSSLNMKQCADRQDRTNVQRRRDGKREIFFTEQ